MKIGRRFSGIGGTNGADFVAEFMVNAVRGMGHDVLAMGSHGGPQVQNVPEGFDFVVHSSGRYLSPELVEKFRKKTKVVLWTHNDEMHDWNEVIFPITNLVDIHYSYTEAHPYGGHVRILPLAADETIYQPRGDCFYEFDVAMIGARRDWREQFAKGIAKKFPRSYFHFDMALSHDQVNEMYNKTRVVLAPVQDCDENDPARAWGCPCRTFDVPASGAVQIQVDRGGLRSVYPNAITLPPIVNVKDAVEVWSDSVEHWIREEDSRLFRASSLYHDTLKRHLYRHRIQSMIDDVKEISE